MHKLKYELIEILIFYIKIFKYPNENPDEVSKNIIDTLRKFTEQQS
ncbi:hypothetical protein LCGC14_1856590 [marine sediment metagenome]|uniref:Uncharacterized protein n=1 Tax=marine sediment metagenome TaxID=412755 RepID=A0A0F9G8R0_9ZZZZ